MKKLLILILNIGLTTSLWSQGAAALSHYFKIKDALVSGQAAVAQEHAHHLVTEVQLMLQHNEGADKKQQRWLESFLKDAKAFSSSANLESQRVLFYNITQKMITLADRKMVGNQPVFVLYCPMKQASWLHTSEEVKNPYYGNQMLNCGHVTRKITP